MRRNSNGQNQPEVETIKIPNLDEFFLFTYTDGLTETFNVEEEVFGFDRLLEIIEGDCPKDLSEFHTQILNQLNEYKGEKPFYDDITMLSCRIQNR